MIVLCVSLNVDITLGRIRDVMSLFGPTPIQFNVFKCGTSPSM